MTPDLNKSIFTLSDMLNCLATAQDSWAKECGADMDDIEDEEDGYVVPINKSEYFLKRYDIDLTKL